MELNCWVLGDRSDCIFSVKIAANESVCSLKEAIKEKMGPAFDRVPAKTLVLWNVSNKSILANRRIKDNVVALGLDNEDPMSPVMSLEEVFSSMPVAGIRLRVHVVINALPLSKHRNSMFVYLYPC